MTKYVNKIMHEQNTVMKIYKSRNVCFFWIFPAVPYFRIEIENAHSLIA